MTIDPHQISGMTQAQLFAVLGNALATTARDFLQSSIKEVTGAKHELSASTTFAELGITEQQKDKVLELASQKAEQQKLALESDGPKPPHDLVQTISDATNYILHIY